MNKQILKILIFVGLFISSLVNVFALDANIQLNKSETDINDYINLRVEISSSEGGEIGITKINGIDNFEVINQSQSQSSSTSIVVENGKSERKTKTTINLDLTLKANKKGNYIIGPVILQSGNDKIETNSVKIKVSGDNLFINNNHLSIPKNTGNNIKQQKNNLQKTINKNTNIETYNNVEKKDFNNNNVLYLLLGVLMIIGLGFYFIFKNNPELLEKVLKKGDGNLLNNNDNKSNDESNGVSNEIDFENIDEIIYPEVNDEKFVFKIIDIFRKKIRGKYKLNNIDNKTLEEIIIDIDEEDKFKELIELINKAKYSNIILDNNRILFLIKEI